jgi:beta-lactamase superfamily II metal-dependent hydrolase
MFNCQLSFFLMKHIFGLLLFLGISSIATAADLKIYFIDVEGGQSTLIVTPSGQSLLVDTGFPSDGTFSSKPGDPHKARDANRIAAVAAAAGVKSIDYLLITHFHADHDGAVPELAQLIPIRGFIDHEGLDDPGTVPGTREAFNAYARVRATGKHLPVKPGDVLPLKGVRATVVSSAGATLSSALPGAGTPNSTCASGAALPAQEQFENPRSTGFRLDYGEFRFADLGDLSGEPLWALFCPKDLLGPLDVYLLPHHGGPDAAHPATLGSALPRVAIVNNGATKGGAAGTLSTLHRAGNVGVWQLHRSLDPGAVNFADDQTANLNESTAHWIEVIAKADGSFTVINSRTVAQKSYAPHSKRSS